MQSATDTLVALCIVNPRGSWFAEKQLAEKQLAEKQFCAG